jgi:putative copper export protein
VLLGTGAGATIFHMPAINALWETGYGVAILVKIGILAAALCLAAGSLLRVKPRLAAAREGPELAGGAARLLPVLIGGEAILVAGAVLEATSSRSSSRPTRQRHPTPSRCASPATASPSAAPT